MATNPTTLTGLQGNVSIPRMTSTSTGYWVGEGSAPSESQQALIDQHDIKTVAAFVDYSRRLQSSIDVESAIRDDLAKLLLQSWITAIYGTGSSTSLGIKDTNVSLTNNYNIWNFC